MAKSSNPLHRMYNGTAFPIWHGGIFITAAHVYKNAAAAGHVVIGRFATHEGGIPAYFVDHAELWDDLDSAIVRCPMLASFPPVPVDLESHLHVFRDEVSALGYPLKCRPGTSNRRLSWVCWSHRRLASDLPRAGSAVWYELSLGFHHRGGCQVRP